MQQVQTPATEKPAKKKPARKKESRKANATNVKAAVKRTAKKKKTGRGKTGLIAYLTESLLAGKTTEQILEGLPKACPQSKAGPKDVSIVRSKLRKEGRLPAK